MDNAEHRCDMCTKLQLTIRLLNRRFPTLEWITEQKLVELMRGGNFSHQFGSRYIGVHVSDHPILTAIFGDIDCFIVMHKDKGIVIHADKPWRDQDLSILESE
jgi:hypothetical protein